jgi:hypothetical protein
LLAFWRPRCAKRRQQTQRCLVHGEYASRPRRKAQQCFAQRSLFFVPAGDRDSRTRSGVVSSATPERATDVAPSIGWAAFLRVVCANGWPKARESNRYFGIRAKVGIDARSLPSPIPGSDCIDFSADPSGASPQEGCGSFDRVSNHCTSNKCCGDWLRQVERLRIYCGPPPPRELPVSADNFLLSRHAQAPTSVASDRSHRSEIPSIKFGHRRSMRKNFCQPT